ncbi:MAG TPA: NUDIX hydrolase [Blastocatellia bacterium]|nr:NUDIX hydrolase [Blastocatellia bacterium]
MSDQFEWQEVKTVYREKRETKHGEELRWLINREKILNKATGKTTTRGTIRHPGICVIAPFVEDDHIALMRQYRYAADSELWELPAGTLNGREENQRMIATETPEECAARELSEETGYQAEVLEKICECYAMPGSSDEVIHVFFARGLKRHEQSLDEDEIINEIRAFSLSGLEEMIVRGEIRDAKTLVGLFYALKRSPSVERIATR